MTFTFGTTQENVSVYNVNKTISKELDYASVVIPFSSRKSRYEPFSLVTVDLDTTIEYWLVNTDTTRPVDMNERTKHRHEMTLIELTKLLERYPMPNRAFTKGETLLDVVQNIIDTVPFDDTYNYTETRFIKSIDATLSNKLDDYITPDIFMSERTLFEALDELFSIISAVPRLTIVGGEFMLTADYYNDIANLVDLETGIANRVEVQQINKYATSMMVSGSNQVDRNVTVLEPSATGWLGFRGDGGLLDVERSFIQVQKPIELINQAWIRFEYDSTEYIYDCTDYIVDSDVRKALNTVGSEDDENSNGILDVYEDIYQDNTLEYTRGSNKIDGAWDLYQPDVSGGNEKYAIVLMIRTLWYENEGTTPVSLFDTATEIATIVNTVRFRIEYIPKINARQEIERKDLSEFSTRSTLIKGQSNRELSSKKMLSDTYSELQRIGNTEIQTGVHNVSLSEVLPIGSYTLDGYILTDIERFKYQEHYDGKYKWTKNYQKVSEFLSLNSEIKLFEIQTSLIRNEVFKQYVVIDTSSVENNSYIDPIAIYTFFNSMVGQSAYNLPINTTVFQSADMAVNGCIRAVTAYGGANTLNFHFGFDSPLSAGVRVVDVGVRKQNEIVKYTNDNYELEDFNCYYANDTTFDIDDYPIASVPSVPLISARGFKTKKDKSDILALTYQLIITAQQGLDVFIGEKFTSENNLLQDRTTFETLKVYVSENKIRSTSNIKYEATEDLDATITVNAGARYIEVSNVATDKYWAIANAYGELYLACNELNTFKLYFNFRNDRQDSTYQPPVLPPINLTAISGSDAIFFDWDDQGTSDSFNVKITENGTTIANTNTTNTFYNFTDLDPDTEYVLSVRANVGGQYSVFSSITKSTTLGAPAMPTYINTTVVNSTTITVDWEQVVGEEYYQVAWSTDGSNWYNTQTTGANDNDYTYSNLSPSTTYYFRVRAGNSEFGDSDWFDNYPEDPTSTPAPSPTSNPSINYVGQTEEYIIVTFDNNDSREVTIYFEADDSTPDARTVVVSGNSTSSNQTIYDETGSHTLYYYAEASGADPSSTLSYPFTLTATTAPDAPSGFDVLDVLLDEIYFSWIDNSTNEDNFVIELHTNSSFTNLYDSLTANANAQTGLIAGVASGTYYARIKATNSIGDSVWVSNVDNPIVIT